MSYNWQFIYVWLNKFRLNKLTKKKNINIYIYYGQKN